MPEFLLFSSKHLELIRMFKQRGKDSIACLTVFKLFQNISLRITILTIFMHNFLFCLLFKNSFFAINLSWYFFI
jgi:hypothetical protein